MTLRDALEEYLTVRRALGFILSHPSRLLHKFVASMEEEGVSFITTEFALRWAMQPRCAPAQWASYLSMVRRFARYVSAFDDRTEIPPCGLLPYRARRKEPYLYTDEEIARLVRAAKELPSPLGLRGATYATLLGLLAVTGMRVSEPVGLDRDDVDLGRGILTIRRTKFGKSRMVPLHASTLEALRRYVDLRGRLFPGVRSFFVNERGSRLTVNGVETTFVRLSRQTGLRRTGRAMAHGSMTCVTDSPLRPCSGGIGKTSTSSGTCLNSVPISAIPMSPTRTGISRPSPSFCNWPRVVLKGETCDEDRP